ncbi:MAG TPA: endonuclease/exonuclease/phosphatase family protein [Kofleriaceae bacterium]|nr:endonuclease/exonuclease/phosphatase family protein [Kofleriaceae bacterium]
MNPSRLRVLSYNIHSGRGTDRRVDLARIADVIGACDPDIVALQEVDVCRARSGAIDQPAALAAQLGMSACFEMCIEEGGERYGIATLTRLPLIESRRLALPHEPHRKRSEPRCALVTRLAWPGAGIEVDMVNTHLSVLAGERPAQVAAIARELPGREVIIAGDFNCTPGAAAFRTLAGGMRSATRGARTFPSWLPLVPLDHILVRGPLEVVRGGRWTEGPVRRASDHLPVYAELSHGASA